MAGSLAPDLTLVKGTMGSRPGVTIAPGVVVGAKEICLIAGPCSVESEAQLLKIAEFAVDSGARALRGGAFKPRTSPYSFQGLGVDGLSILKTAKAKTGLPVVSEVLDVRMIEEMHDYVDVFQVGARNMYNYPLLKELGKLDKPVLLKRSMMATIEEYLSAAEYLLVRGNKNIILCERGIRSFDNSTRFVLDLTAVSVLKERTQLPVVVDPSHGTGVSRYVEPMALAAIAAGADGLLIEVHYEPESALSDGAQSLSFDQFKSLSSKIKRVADAVGRSF